MKRKLTSMATLLLAVVMLVSACSGGNGGNNGGNSAGETAKAGNNAGGETSGDKGAKTKLEFWTFQQLHADFYVEMAKRWNEANPDKQIELVANVSPFDDVHNKLLVSLQSGSGAPDLADIELGK
ncbi:extracellular solute-binding protein, partial [Paenibacillus sp. SCIV0701]|nr:extracellular solute-binding protein [Paenibacillus soyae]